uniref:Uncharacterized protein n=1 Tax=Anguilla anguilla TaxID=7936 RepID=A0A0E9WR67_ANGAN
MKYRQWKTQQDQSGLIFNPLIFRNNRCILRKNTPIRAKRLGGEERKISKIQYLYIWFLSVN